MGNEEAMASVEGEECVIPNCPGRIIPQEFKGKEAMVCDECDTPVVRIWI